MSYALEPLVVAVLMNLADGQTTIAIYSSFALKNMFSHFIVVIKQLRALVSPHNTHKHIHTHIYTYTHTHIYIHTHTNTPKDF